MSKENLRAAVLISGGGTNMEKAIQGCQEKIITGIEPVLVIASKDNAGGIAKAERLGIHTEVRNRKMFRMEGRQDEEVEALFEASVLELLQDYGVSLIAQLGWLLHTPEKVISAYQSSDKVIFNLHPAEIDPGRGHDFGGKGMYGLAPHCARIAYLWMTGEKPQTASTIHYVTPVYDEGDLISVIDMDLIGFDFIIDPKDLNQEKYQEELIQRTYASQKALLPIEHANVIVTLKRFGSGETVSGYRRESPLVSPKNYDILEISKSEAVQLFPKG